MTQMTKKEAKFRKTPIVKKRTDGCYLFTYCGECMAFPMGIGCPNIKQIKKDRKVLRKENLMDKCRFDLNKMREEIIRLKKWKRSLGVRYTYHANKRWRTKNNE